MKTVIAQFVRNVQQNQHTYSHSNSKSRDINKAKNLVFKQISPSDFEVIM